MPGVPFVPGEVHLRGRVLGPDGVYRRTAEAPTPPAPLHERLAGLEAAKPVGWAADPFVERGAPVAMPADPFEALLTSDPRERNATRRMSGRELNRHHLDRRAAEKAAAEVAALADAAKAAAAQARRDAEPVVEWDWEQDAADEHLSMNELLEQLGYAQEEE